MWLWGAVGAPMIRGMNARRSRGRASSPPTPVPDAAPADRRQLWTVVLAVCGVLACFANKAFTIDDTLFLALARHLTAEPWDFYGFDVNWYGVEMPMWRITKNPPLGGYVLALAGSLSGWREVPIHLLFLIPAGFAAAGTFRLAQRFCARPVEASLLGLLTPVFLVSSTNVMCDTLMVAFFVWSVEWWLRGADGRRGAAGVAVVLVGLAGLTKYFGFALVPLLLAVDLWRFRRARPVLAWLLVPVGVALAYQLGTQAMYGRGLLLDAADYSGRLREFEHGSRIAWLDQGFVGLAFLGGCLLPATTLAFGLWRRRVWLTGLGVLIAGSTATWAAGWLPGLDVEAVTLRPIGWIHLQAWTMFLGGASLLGLVVWDLWRRRDWASALLTLWVLGTWIFAAHLNWVNNGRSNLPLAPVVGILLIRGLGNVGWPAWSRATRIGAVVAVAAALSVATADTLRAGRARTAAEQILRDHRRPGSTLWFQGHWGFQYYMERGGARALDLSRDPVQPGDAVVIPDHNTDTFELPPVAVRSERVIRFERGWAHTMGGDLGAGFYASNIGPLPYVFGVGGEDRTEVFRVHQGFTGQLDKSRMPWW